MGTDGPLRPEDITRRRFPTAFRGFEPAEVRAFLTRVADEIAWLRAREEDLRRELEALRNTPPPPLDAATLTAALGEETARIVHTAQQAAADIRARADEKVAQILRDAHDEAERLRNDALNEAARRSQQLVREAEEARDRILGDLAERRRVAHLQVEQLEAGRERLLQAYTLVRGTFEEAVAELERVEREAPAAAEAVARRAESMPSTPSPPPRAESAPPAVAPVPVADTEQDPEPQPQPRLEPEPAPPQVSDAAVEPEAHGEPEVPVTLAIVEPGDELESVRVLDPVAAEPEVRSESHAITTVPADEQLRATRDAMLEPIRSVLARKVKRVLQDEQNDVLDRLRMHRRMPSLDDLLLNESAQRERYADAVEESLWEAARAGSGAGGERASVDVRPAALSLAGDVVGTLRRRLGRAIEESLGSADPEALSDGVSAAYREWKSPRIERLVADHLAAAHTLGAFAATPDGTTLRWVVEDVDGPCPDCDDNALAGATLKGDQFPTGQQHPPAHAGCRCLLAPAHA